MNDLFRLLFRSPLIDGIKKLLETVVDAVIKSPVEQDLGEDSGVDIVLPDAVFETRVPLKQMAPPLLTMFEQIEGLEVDHVTKIGTRLRELPRGKSASFRYQVTHQGVHSELQVKMTKVDCDTIWMSMRSSNGVIATIRKAFG